MSLPYVIYWPPSNGNTGAIASTQALTEAGNLTLNTNIPNILSANPSTTVNTGGPYIFNGIARAVSITSTANLSGLTITIYGIGSPVDTDGNPTFPFEFSEDTIIGPNNSTVQSDYIFTQVNSISIDGAASNISAGFGTSGITQYIFPDYNKTGWYASCSAQVISPVDLTYTGYMSLNKPNIPGTNGQELSYKELYGENIPAFPISTDMTGANDNQIANFSNQPVSSIWLSIKDNNLANAGESLVFTVLQQGIV